MFKQLTHSKQSKHFVGLNSNAKKQTEEQRYRDVKTFSLQVLQDTNACSLGGKGTDQLQATKF
jgi:hypothetical protein